MPLAINERYGQTSTKNDESTSTIRNFDFSENASSLLNENESFVDTMHFLPSLSTTTLYRDDEEKNKRKSKFDITLTEGDLVNCDDIIS